MLQRIANVPGVFERDLSTVEWILQGAAMMPPSLLRTWFELLAPEKIVMAYGMTEQLGLTSLRGDEWLEHEGSVADQGVVGAVLLVDVARIVGGVDDGLAGWHARPERRLGEA